MDKKGTVRRLFVLMGGYRWLEIVSMVTVAASAAMNLLAYVRVYYVGEAVLTTAGDLSSIDRQAIAALGWDAVLFIMTASCATWGGSPWVTTWQIPRASCAR